MTWILYGCIIPRVSRCLMLFSMIAKGFQPLERVRFIFRASNGRKNVSAEHRRQPPRSEGSRARKPLWVYADVASLLRQFHTVFITLAVANHFKLIPKVTSLNIVRARNIYTTHRFPIALALWLPYGHGGMATNWHKYRSGI